jgi:hypothetical protein
MSVACEPVAACPSHLYLIIRKTVYRVRALRCDRTAALRAFRLGKADGTIYDVKQTHFGNECDCPDFIFRRDGLDPNGCKHVKALVAEGLLDGGEPPGDEPVADGASTPRERPRAAAGARR